ncbi:DUF418 domain-containing protein [Flavicella marina]|uniref:DUF418 domain-containing protein n=1 Tax=Flavicella marina TaxID=1475951 RepID=UPI00186B576E|nr:DUF418 domain-containing protein [Flavicella marina]
MSDTKSRIEVVDSLRGFAIMGILLLHSIEHFNFYVFPKNESQPDWLNQLDTIVWDSLFFLFGGKGYAIFALLFGFTFSLMYAKQKLKGIDFGARFAWRMVLLACFAFVNGMFFPGEVLLLYSIIGFVLILVRNLPDKWLLLIAILLLSQPIEWFHYVRHLLDENYLVPDYNLGEYWQMLKKGQLSNSLGELITMNTLYGHKVGLLWALNVGRMVQSAGLFVFGFWLGNKKLFSASSESIAFWKKLLLFSIVAFSVFYLVEMNFDFFSKKEVVRKSLLRAVNMYKNLAFTLVLVAGFVLLFQKEAIKKVLQKLSFLGRMSLTAYVTQSIMGGFVFYNYGLGLGPHIKHSLSFVVGIVLFVFQYQLCKFWIQKYKQGPLEKLWHKLTWIKF